jgi:hypothetical protein
MEVDNFTAFSAQIESTVGKALTELKKEYGGSKSKERRSGDNGNPAAERLGLETAVKMAATGGHRWQVRGREMGPCADGEA